MAHDDQNTARVNFVPHPVYSDIERGLPVQNKVVSRLDTPGVLEICVDPTTPDPDMAGGGTWQALSGGGSYTTWTPVLSQGGTTFTTTTVYSRIRSDGGRVDGACAVTITAGTGIPTFPVKLDGMTPNAGTGVIGGGYFFSNCADVGSGRIDGWCAPGFSGTTFTGFGVIGRTTSFGVAETLDVGDTVVCEFWYPI